MYLKTAVRAIYMLVFKMIYNVVAMKLYIVAFRTYFSVFFKMIHNIK